MGMAAYGMRKWRTAIDHFQAVCNEFPENSEAGNQLKRATDRLTESQTGRFDLKRLHTEAQEGVRKFDVADYTGPIEIATVPDKGSSNFSTGLDFLVYFKNSLF